MLCEVEKKANIFNRYNQVPYLTGAQWLSGRVLDSRPKGRGFEPHRRHCVVSLSKNINPSLELVQPRKTRPYITERLLMERKESKQTNKQTIPDGDTAWVGLIVLFIVAPIICVWSLFCCTILSVLSRFAEGELVALRCLTTVAFKCSVFLPHDDVSWSVYFLAILSYLNAF